MSQISIYALRIAFLRAVCPFFGANDPAEMTFCVPDDVFVCLRRTT